MKLTIMTRVLPLFIFSLFTTLAYGQISGTVTEAENASEPLAFANVLLINPADSSFIKAELTDINGNYTFNKIEKGKYQVKVMMISYADYYSEVFEYSEGKMTVDCAVSSSAVELGTVEVVSKVPFLEQKAGMMVVNVEKNITGVNGSMMDVLKKVPGVMVVNNNITLAGSPGVRILIDGKPTDYLDLESLLRDMSADDIAKIEVSSQPGASMDAAGTGGVINIILKKNTLTGTNGSVKVGAGYGQLWKYSTSFNLNHRKGAYNIYGSGGYSHNTWQQTMLIKRAVEDDIFDQSALEPSLPHTYRAKAGIDYDINDNQAVGFSIKGLTSNNEKTNINETMILFANEDQLSLKTNNDIDRQWNYITGDVYYNIKLDTSGQKMTFSTNYSVYDYDEISDLEVSPFLGNYDQDQINDMTGLNKIFAIKADYKYPINKQWGINSGLKYSYANIDNNLQVFDREDNNHYTLNKNSSNHYIFKEDISAAYIQGEYDSDKIDVQAGLRYEYSNSEGYSVTLDSTRNRRISQLFPSAGITIPVSKVLGVSLAYSYRIRRPKYSTLNPFVYKYDPYTYEKGNTFLRPSFSHTGKASLTYEGQPFFNLEYKKTKDVIMFVTEQDDEAGATFATNVNLDSYEKYGASLFFPLDFTKVASGYGGVFVNYDKYKSDYLGDLYNRSKWSFIGFLQASTKLPGKTKMEVTGWYNHGGLEGIMDFNNLYGVSVGFEKKFLNEQLIAKLSFDDILFKYWSATIDYSNMDLQIEQQWETRVVNLELVYKFGNRFLKKGDKVKSSASEENRRIDNKQ